MNNVKINLTVVLPGANMKSEEECKRDDDYIGFSVELPKKRVIHTLLRNSRTAKQVLHISQEAYEYMVGQDCPPNTDNKRWRTMSKKQKIDIHMKQICEHLGGLSYSYVILDD